MADEMMQGEEMALDADVEAEGAGIDPDDEDLTAAPAEEELEPAEDLEGGSSMVHTSDEIPELAGLDVGDTITFRITDRTEQNEFEMTAIAEAPTDIGEAPEEGGMPMEAGGRDDVVASLIS